MFTEDSTNSYTTHDDMWTTVIVWANMRQEIMIVDTDIIGKTGTQYIKIFLTSEQCSRECKEDCCCKAFSYDKMAICKLFTSKTIYFLDGKEDSTTVFIGRNLTT